MPSVSVSLEEIEMTVALLMALGLPWNTQAVIDVMVAGAKRDLWDAFIPLDDRASILMDYDGKYYHNENNY